MVTKLDAMVATRLLRGIVTMPLPARFLFPVLINGLDAMRAATMAPWGAMGANHRTD